jgi:hypothetical protein
MSEKSAIRKIRSDISYEDRYSHMETKVGLIQPMGK